MAGNGTDGQLGIFITEDLDNSVYSTTRRNEDPQLVEDSDLSKAIEKCCFFHEVAGFGPENRAVQVACGENFTLVLNEKGRVFSFGKSTYHRLGLSEI